MAKFFLPLIVLTLIAWIIVGVQQEYNNLRFKINNDSISIIIPPNYSDSLILDKYNDFKLNIVGNLNFLLPSSMVITTDLTNEIDAYLQCDRNDYTPLNFIVYKDEFSSDSSAYNYSLENYVNATIAANKEKSFFFKIDDSLSFNLPSGEKAIMVTFRRSTLDSTKSLQSISFLATSDEENLYKFYFYCDTAYYQFSLKDIHKVFTSSSIVKS